MRLFFLSGYTHLTKSFSRLPTGELEKSAYPMVKRFTSHEELATDPGAFYAHLRQHADAGHCLSKGILHKRLEKESRAGSTASLDPTQWSCFDLDNVSGFESVDAFIQQVLPSAFHNATYILQHSASAGIASGGGLRAHLFYMHDREFSPQDAHLYVTELNLTHAVLSRQLELTACGTGLRYPLDRSIMQNDKLIYIAPPTFGEGVADPIPPPRIHLVPRERDSVSFDWRTKRAPAAIERERHAFINTLRERDGLGKKAAKLRPLVQGGVLLTNPDVARVTGEKRARGFVYLNLNCGDSWGYYYNERNPRYLRNFKGEPTVVLKDFVPAYYAEVAPRLKKTRLKRTRVPFAFRHRETDTIWNGVYDTVNDRVRGLAPTSRQSLKDFFAQFGDEVPQIDDWRFDFEPWNPNVIDFEKKFCNQFERSKYLRETRTIDAIPPMTHRVIMSVVGNDAVCYAHFINWLAFILQYRKKTFTAWILHGVQGTGKGVLFHQVLSPIFGRKYCLIKQVASLDDRFNSEMQRCLLYLLDETQVELTAQGARAVARLKNMITEPMLEIRGMRQAALQLPNYTNYIMHSNRYDAYAMDATDRRFNVAPRQETPFPLTEKDVKVLMAERGDFAAYLRGLRVDVRAARTALNNDAKAAMRGASQDSIGQMCHAVKTGDLSYFMNYADGPMPTNNSMLAWTNYIEVMKRWVDQTAEPCVLRREELLAIFMFLHAPPQVPGVQKFMRMLEHNELVSKPQYCHTRRYNTRGVKTHWRATAEDLETWRAMLNRKPEKPTEGGLVHLEDWKRAKQ